MATAQSLQDLASALQQQAGGNPQLVLNTTNITANAFNWLLQSMGITALTVQVSNPTQQITYTSDTQTLRVTGPCTLYGGSLTLSLTLIGADVPSAVSAVTGTFSSFTLTQVVQNNLVNPSLITAALPANTLSNVALTASGAASQFPMAQFQLQAQTSTGLPPLQILPALGLSLSTWGFTLNRTVQQNGNIAITFSIDGTITFGNIEVELSVGLPTGPFDAPNVWTLQFSSETGATGLSIANLVKALGGNNLFQLLPSGITGLLSFTLKTLKIVFDASGTSVISIYCDIGTTDWTVTTGFLIKKAGFIISVSNPFTSNSSTVIAIYGDFQIGTDESDIKVLLDVYMTLPLGGSDWLAEIKGEIDKNNLTNVYQSLPGSAGAQPPPTPPGLNIEQIKLEYLNISFNPATRSLNNVSFSITSQLDFTIIPGFFVVSNPYAAFDINNPLNSATRELSGKIGGFITFNDWLTLEIEANKPQPTSGWTFSGRMLPGETIPLMDLLKKLMAELGIGTLPEWVNATTLDISGVAVSLTTPAPGATDQSNSYTAQGMVNWAIKTNTFNLLNLNATVDIAYQNKITTGSITADVQLLGLDFKAGYKFKSGNNVNDKEVYLEWEGIVCDYLSTNEKDVISLTFGDKSLGDMITALIRSFDPDFVLGSPWNVLNKINLNGLSFVYTRYPAGSSNSDVLQITYSNSNALDFVFLKLTDIRLTKDNTGVYLGFDGTFLGLPISSTDPNTQALAGRGSDVTQMPSVPGGGSKAFDLQYLGLGQHVALYPTKNLNTVEDATSALKNVFQPAPKPQPGKPPILPIPAKPVEPPQDSILIFDNNSNWLIGTQCTIAETLNLSIIFNDPNLYGLLINLAGEKAGVFKNLKFEILYKKVTDTVGVYQIQLQLPDAMRHLEFGEVSITLPIVGVDIYTNGSFKIDFGFPTNLDFSRSLAVQVFPFTGAGGFYFAYLRDIPSDSVPATTVGRFTPIIQFGLGLSLGLGKTIDEGIFSAGLTLTVIGIIEGVIAFYHPNLPSYPGKDERYYWIQGTVGIVGHIFGEVNFAIISARIDIKAYAYVRLTIESYNAIPLYFEAGVSVSVRVRINLGIFSIYISLSFSIKVSFSITIGTDNRKNAPWNYVPGGGNQDRLAAFALPEAITILWQPVLVTPAEKQTLTLYFMPHLTLSGEQGNSQVAQYVGMLYMDAPNPDSPDTKNSLSAFVRAVLLWSINAGINSSATNTTLDNLLQQAVSLSDLQAIYCYLAQDESPFTTMPYASQDNNDIQHFLSNWFTFSIIPPPTDPEAAATDVHGSVFPAIPALQLNYIHNGQASAKVDFSTFNSCNAAYLTEVQDRLAALGVNYENGVGSDDSACTTTNAATGEAAASLSLATFIFQDYVIMTAKAILQDAINTFKAYTHDLSLANGLNAIVDFYNKAPLNNSVTAGAIATANKSVAIINGTAMRISGVAYNVATNDSFDSITALYNKNLATANQLTPANFATTLNNQVVGLIVAGTVITITGYMPYTTTGNDTLLTIAANLVPIVSSTPPATPAQVIGAIQDKPVLTLFAAIVIPDFTYSTTGTDSFGSIADQYALSIDALASVNGQAGFQGATITIPGLTQLEVGILANSTCTATSMLNIAGMSSRFLLHGLRLPDPANPQQLEPLYLLTGQQLALPTLQQNDSYSTVLYKNAGTTWIQLNNDANATSFPVPIDNGEISRINDLISLTLAPGGAALPLDLFRNSLQTFSLRTNIDWIYPGAITLPVGTPLQQTVITPTIWQLPDTLLQLLNNNVGQQLPELVIKVITQQQPNTPFVTTLVQNYGWGTLINLRIKKVDNITAPIVGNVYDVEGADEAGTLYLQRLLTYINVNGDSIISQLQMLYRPNQTGNSSRAGLQSLANGAYTMALVQANLSTETNPVTTRMLTVADAPARNTLNTFKDFISLLWKCSITRSGGYYLYYNTANGGEGLPDYLFAENGSTDISLLVSYGNAATTQDFLTHVLIADTISTATSSVYIESEVFTTINAIVPPGNAGVQVTRPFPGEYVPVNPYPVVPTPQSKASDMTYLLTQFNLLGYNLVAGSGFTAAPLNLVPAGATDNSDDSGTGIAKTAASTDWMYEAMLPIFKFATTQITPADPAYPSSADDPYRGIGHTAQLQLNWQDMFGNLINSQWPGNKGLVSNLLLYNDPLNSMTKWPNLTNGYWFTQSIAPNNLQLFFGFSASRYQSDDKVQRAQADAVTYGSIYYQLIQPDVTCYCQTTLDTKQAQIAIDKTILIKYAGDIYKFLQTIINPALPTVTVTNPVFNLTVAPSNPDDIFELIVTLTISRNPDLIDPAFKDVAGITSTTTTIAAATAAAPPAVVNLQPQTAGADSPIQSLQDFAASFEATFKDKPTAGIVLKVATGLTQNELDNQSGSNKIWVVRFDTTGQSGINLTISNVVQYFFAPIPLSTSLNTYDNVPINSYTTGQPFSINPATALRKTFASVDLDTWGSLCLSAIDEFLSPEYAVPAFLLDNGVTLQKVLDAKEILANAITGTVDTIIEKKATDPDLSSVANAQEVFRQQLLIQLSNAYVIDAIVQNPATVASPYNGTNIQPVKQPPYNPVFYGQMEGQGPASLQANNSSNEYSLSTARVPMGNGASWLNYVFCAKEATNNSNYPFTAMQYKITHIEHDIEDVPGPGVKGYRASAWLNFIIPIDPALGAVGPVDIPIPLRAYPVPPSITAQQAIYRANGQSPEYTTIAEAKSWDFNFTYRQQDAAQDVININVLFNINPVNTAALFAAPVSVLPEALAQFISVYPAIRADFISYLAQVNLTTATQQPSVFANAQAAVAAFTTIVAYVANEWKGWNQVNPLTPPDEDTMDRNALVGLIPNIEVNYTVNEEEAQNGNPASDLWAVITPDPANNAELPLPVISIDGYQPQPVSEQPNTWRFYDSTTSTYLSYKDRNMVNTRQFDFTPLNILDWQNAWAGIFITRNKDLVKGADGKFLTTNSNFIYQTPLVKFYSQLNPLLTCDEGIDIAAINNNGRPQMLNLAVHLSHLFTALLSSNTNESQLIKTECVYQYNLNGTAAYNQITLPVVLCPPAPVDPKKDLNIGNNPPYCPTSEKGFVCTLTNALLQWHAQQNPNPNNAQLVFSIVVYDAFDNQLPVLKLNAVILDVSYISEWSGGGISRGNSVK